MATSRAKYPLIAALVALCVACTACSSLPLPAIDPTGERIFLPSPSYTTVVSPYDSVPNFPCLPQPAFTEPAPIKPCESIPAGPPAIAGTGITPQPPVDRLILSPARIVAPVNSEVVLLAGLCGKEGYYITKQPIEWMLSPDSVGNIISLADSQHPHIAKLVHHSARKESNNLAITRTSTEAHVVSRGTPLPNDDVWVGKGQTWISVSSPTEGVSYVTALAKSAENWETRRQTATIYWVDMQWSFPAPTVVRAGEPAILSTAVSKTSSGNPAANATVRYEVTGGTPASFFGNGRTSVEIPTDENGRANVQLVQDTPAPGATQIRIQIFSRNPQDTSSRVPLGQGFTTVTWSAPGLALVLTGPPLISRGGTGTFRIEVSNPGDIATRSVVVRVDLPAALKYLNSQPAGDPFGQRVEWSLGDLAPRQVQYLEFNCQALNGGEFQTIARASSLDTQEATAAVATRVVESGLSVRFVDPPTAAVVGSRVEFNLEVTNTGGIPLTNVVVRDTFDQGLRPDYAVDPIRPLEQRIGDLAVGQTVQKGIAFIVERAGQLCQTLEATADGGHSSSNRTCIQATQPVLSVEVRKVGPAEARVGDRVRFVMQVTNTGEGVITNLRVADFPDANLLPDQGTHGLEKVDDAIVWRAGSLSPGQQLTYEIECICRTAAQAARNQVEVTADGNVAETAVAQLTILPAVAAPKPSPPQPPPVQPTPKPITPEPASPNDTAFGQLNLRAASYGDPRVGENATIIIVLRNPSDQPEQDVQLTILLPPEFTSVKVEQPTNASVTPVPGKIVIGPIRELRGGESIDQLRVNATATKAGRYTIRIRAESRRTKPVETEVDINVVPR